MAIQFLNDIDLTGDLQLQENQGGTFLKTDLIPTNVGGNSKLKIQGGNYIHRVGFYTSWPTTATGFQYALLTSSYNTSDTKLLLNKSDSSGNVDGSTVISTGNSYFNGNVGINTTSPSEKLHVNGTVRIVGALKDSSNSPGTSGQVLSSTATGTDWIDLAAGGTVTSVATSAPLTGGTITTTGTIGITQATTSADGYLSSTDWNTFNNKTSNTGTVTQVALTIGTSGTDVNVTGTPISTAGTFGLNIPVASASNTGKLSSTDWSTFNGKTSGSGTADKVAKWSSSSALTDSIITATATQVSVDGDSLFDGDTLVDTDSGNQAFYVTRQGSTNESLKMYTTDTIAILQTIQDETTGVYGGMDFKMDDGAPSPRFRFTYGETTRMTIQSNGRVGIATTSPSQTFHVNGSSRCNFLGVGANAQGTPRVYLQQAASATTSAKFIKIKNTVALDSSGVRIMDFLDSDNTVRGFIHYDDTSTTYSTTSDYRLKENIEPIPNSIDKIKELKPCRFNFIGNDNKVDGFIAHEVQEVVKEAVTGEKDAVNKKGEPIHQGLDQSKIVPLLTAALKEAIDKIESLESRIQTLENK